MMKILQRTLEATSSGIFKDFQGNSSARSAYRSKKEDEEEEQGYYTAVDYDQSYIPAPALTFLLDPNPLEILEYYTVIYM